MFGLLGGLGGGLFRGGGMFRGGGGGLLGRRGGGGLLGGLLNNALNPRQSRPSSLGGGGGPSRPGQAPDDQQPQQAEPAQAAQVVEQPTGAPPVQAAVDAAPVEQVAQGIQQAEQQRQIARAEPEALPDQRPVTEGLLEEAPPAASPRPDSTQDELPPPQTVVNQTEADTPVARPADETFPNVPQFALSGLVDTVGDIPPRKNIIVEDPVPTRPADTRSQARHTGNSPMYAPQLAQTATAYNPNYSYRR